jgi:REP element-mobilizing transposase RayT/DNA-binding CsgD family transcriptional regulator
MAGFHHIVNRGIERSNVYRSDEDKEKFLQIVCKACGVYKVNVHDYCLMDNHYHLLIQTTRENLSLFMRQVNSNYATYFNKKYKRSGYLWQGRYRSWYVVTDEYLYGLFRYIEQNPIKAKVVQTIGEYPFTLLGTLYNENLEVITCAKHSRLLEELEHESIQVQIEIMLNEEELGKLKKEQNRKILVKEHEYKYEKDKTLEVHFSEAVTKKERNLVMIEAIEDGYKQVEIAKYLGISSSTVSKILLEDRSKSRNL